MIVKNVYKIYSNKIHRDVKIVQISDIHYSNKTPNKKLELLVKEIYISNPNYLVVCGDIFDNITIECKSLINFFKEICKKYPVYVILGNHDLIEKNNMSSKKCIEKISSIKGLTLLRNESAYLKKYNINIIGLEPSNDYYRSGENAEYFINFVNNLNININSSSFNEILCHSPKVILNKKYYNKIKICNNVDLIQSGHMHNGALPDLLNKIYPKNKGLINPNKTLFPMVARGCIKINKTTGIISGPVTMLSEGRGFISKIMNKLVKIHLEEIYILKDINGKN